MSAPRIDYANLPQAADIEALYVAGERAAVMVSRFGFSDQKIRTIVAARGVPIRRVGRPGPQQPSMSSETAPEPIAPRDPCGWCGKRRDVGCKHYPLLEEV